MGQNNGWIKLHRQLLDTGFHNKPNYLSLWITLLLMANHKEQSISWNGEDLTIKEGQILTGRKELSKQTGIAETTIERILRTLENGHQIEQQKTTKFRLISIKKWKNFQEFDSKVDNKRTTNGHIQECKNEKKDNIIIANAIDKKPLEGITMNIPKEKYISLADLYGSMGIPKKVRNVSQWQDEASNAYKYFLDGEEKRSSIFKCFRDDQHHARIAFSDCKELGKKSALYFLKVYNELRK